MDDPLADPSGDGDPVAVNLGSLGPLATATVVYDMVAADAVGQKLINQATVDDDAGDPVTSQPAVEIPIDQASVFDPPSATKVINAVGAAEIEWKMVWINDGNIAAMATDIVDPMPVGTFFSTESPQNPPAGAVLDGSLYCEARGASTVTLCEYDAANDRVHYPGDIAADLNATGEDDALNEVVIVYRTTLERGITSVENQACAQFDADGDGFIGDEVAAGQTPVCSDDPAVDGNENPTRWVQANVPALSSWGLLLLTVLIGLAAAGRLRRRHRWFLRV